MQHLRPHLQDATAEYVLIQAWKKTVSYIRTHNWFADTLELDQATANLPAFIADLMSSMASPESWVSTPLRLVPAPKSQRWSDRGGVWKPLGSPGMVKVRPLAHVALRDQVAATALMMCLADTVETAQGDPRASARSKADRTKVVSYGNRLFCDADPNGSLRHRWGTTTTYRAYFQDYRTFLARPELVAAEVDGEDGKTAIIQTDLSQFYDRVRPQALQAGLARLLGDGEAAFDDLCRRVLNWTWHRDDLKSARAYAMPAKINDFDRIALPQGLVSAGFFANVVLLELDDSLRTMVGQDLAPGVRLRDACRYVDDLRLVVSLDDAMKPDDVEMRIVEALAGILDAHAPGMVVSEEKTKLALFRGEERPLIRQSRKMARIQSAVSGGFDAAGGEEIIEAVQGLMRTQQRFSEREARSDHAYASPFSSIPDVADGTVSRFAAARFRSTYRSLRPLLEAAGRDLVVGSPVDDVDADLLRRRGRTQSELDDEARSFAYGLVESWIEDPSNVRLLRIALDIWPAADVLDYVLNLIRPYTTGGGRGGRRRIALYCLSEILRAGATETAFVADPDCLPEGVDVEQYRNCLKDEAIRLLSSSNSLPWYLKQQAYLYLAVVAPEEAPVSRLGSVPETKDYRDLLRFLRGDEDHGTVERFATKAVVVRRSFLDREASVALVAKHLNDRKLAQIAYRDPAFAAELVASATRTDIVVPEGVGIDLCLVQWMPKPGLVSLADLVLSDPSRPLRNEISISSFALALAKAICELPERYPVLRPVNVFLQTRLEDGLTVVERIDLNSPRRREDDHSLYRPPSWCLPAERWRFQIGYLLRFILTARRDFTETVRPPTWHDRNTIYRASKSHWYQRLHGFYNGHEAFGDDWLPISDKIERLLFDLLAWPGCRNHDRGRFKWSDLAGSIAAFEDVFREATKTRGPASGLLFLPLSPPKLPAIRSDETFRPLRGCVVQLTMPEDVVKDDLTLSEPEVRKRHRNHLATAIAAVEKAIALRETHKPQDRRLDWLILPELSVHPDDVRTHLVPFARSYKAIVFAGTTYEEIEPDRPLVNSAKWIIPTRTPSGGLRMIVRRQGKYHLARMEETFNDPDELIRGFRPCQWLVPYPYRDRPNAEHLWLTGAICYDATDMALPADLRERSDIFAISALNQDIDTFDQMALALHYHMYQMVVIANNGRYGGSNAYLPMKDSFRKQIFHTHGQPQASISFFEIDRPNEMKDRVSLGKKPAAKPIRGGWKYPPAGL